jgi:hypothetical protein
MALKVFPCLLYNKERLIAFPKYGSEHKPKIDMLSCSWN